MTVPISVDTSTFTSELTNQMKNGYFLEGFVFFKDAKTKKDLVSLPYIGFKGQYQDLPGIEKPIYAFTGDEKPFYYYANEKQRNLKKIQEITLQPWSALFGAGAKKCRLSWEKKMGITMEISSSSRQMMMDPMIVSNSMQWS
ncbi:hypothetical protein SD436_05395 [Streptococcus sp. 2A/TPW/M5]